MRKVLKGNFIFTRIFGEYEIYRDFYLAIENGKIVDFFKFLPIKYKNWELIEYKDKMIIPSFMDIHLHGAQFENIGLGMDLPLLPWLETYTFPEENKFASNDYAEKVYDKFVKDLIYHGTTRACVFGTIHESSKILFDKFIEYGIGGYIGKVNMNRNCPEYLQEKNSYEETLNFLDYTINKSDMVKPIITPRFIPSCTNELMEKLGKLAEEKKLLVQSHLSENKDEIKWVKELQPDTSYTGAYQKYNMLGEKNISIMAHCVHISDAELPLMQNENFYVAHCPTSNFALKSGLAGIRRFLDNNINVGIGTDVSGGYTLSMRQCIVAAVETSNLYDTYVEKSKPLSMCEAFYLGTKGGGKIFGNVGSFEVGYEFDALVIDDNSTLPLEKRLEKFIFDGKNEDIIEVYAKGVQIK
ncbi:MAG: amidohydrolase family protein [Lachnospirales bacterium]